MPRRILHRLSLLLVVAFAATACEHHPTEAPLATGEAALAVYANVGEADVAELVVEVTAADITTPLVFNLTVQEGVASGSLRLPAGSNRLVTVRGFSMTGEVTHHGEATVSVRAGENPPLSITLAPLAGSQPIEVRFGSRVVIVYPSSFSMQTGDTYHLWAEVLNDEGEFVTEQVRWASTNPARATVDEDGRVTAKRAGAVEIVATYEGTAGSAQVSIWGEEGRENNTTELLDFGISPPEVNVTGASAQVEFTIRFRDLAHGVQWADVTVQSPNLGMHGYCYAEQVHEGDAHEATWKCSVTIPADSDPGEWRVTSIGGGNYSSGTTYYGEGELADAGLPGTFTVISENPDTEAPELNDLSFTPDSVHIEGEHDNAYVTVNIRASDFGSGIRYLNVNFAHKASDKNAGCGFWHDQDPRNEIDDSCTVHLAGSWYESGEYLATVALEDATGNFVYITTEELEARGFPARLTVTRYDD